MGVLTRGGWVILLSLPTQFCLIAILIRGAESSTYASSQWVLFMMCLCMMDILYFYDNHFPHIVGTMLVGSKMYRRLVYHTVWEDPLSQGLQSPSNRMLQRYRRIYFPLHIFYEEVVYQLGVGGDVPGFLRFRLLELLDGLCMLGGKEKFLRNDYFPIFCVSRWGLHHYLTMHIWLGIVGIVTWKAVQEEML